MALFLHPVIVVSITQLSSLTVTKKPPDTSSVYEEDGVAGGGYCWGARFPDIWMETPTPVSQSELALGPTPYRVTADRQPSALGRALGGPQRSDLPHLGLSTCLSLFLLEKQ